MDTLKAIMMVFLFLGVVSCAPLQQNKIVTIGIVVSPDEYGINVLRGIQMAVNETGLEKVRLVVQKAKCDASAVESIAEKLMILQKSSVIIEGVCPELATKLIPLAAEKEVVVVSAVSSAVGAPNLSSPFFFRTIPSDEAEAVFAANLMKQQGHTKTATIKLIGAESSNFGKQLEAIADTEITALHVMADSPLAARQFLRVRQQRALSIPIYGSKWFNTEEILELGEAAEGLTIITPRLGNIGFIAKYTKEYGVEPGLFAAQGYDAYKTLATAVQQDARSGEEIRKALLTMEFPGSSGTVDFDENGNVAGSFEVYVVKEGKFELQ